MSKPLLALVVAAALGLTVFLVLGLLRDREGAGEVGDPADAPAVREGEDEGAHLQGTGTPGELVVARSADLWITGLVRDGDGKPLAGCRVGARPRRQQGRDPRDPSTWMRSRSGDWGLGTRGDDDLLDARPDEPFTPTHEVTSGANGRFEIAVDRLARYDVRALVEAPRVSSTATAYLYPQRTTANVDLTVVEGRPLAGRVVDANDAPVAAVVRGVIAGEGRVRCIADATSTDPADGGFGWAALPPGKGTFDVVIPGRLVLRGREVTLPHDGVWTIRLDAATGAVAGHVFDGAGAPIAGARVLVDTGKALARQATDDTGAWRVDGLPESEVRRVVVEAEGYGLATETPPLAPWAGAVVKEGETTTIDVTLHPGATVQGVVREVGSGKALAGVEVFALRRTADTTQSPVPNTRTDAAGRYVLAGIPPGLHILLARSPTHHLPQLAAPQPTSFAMTPQGLPITPGPPPELLLLVARTDTTLTKDLALSPGLTLTGRVVDPEGEAIAGAQVHTDQAALSQAAYRWGVSWPGWGLPLATTGEDGRFVATGLPPSDALALRATKKPLASSQPVTVRLKRDEPIEEVVIQLAPCIVVEGRVLGPDGEGVEAWVNAWSTAGGNAGYAYATTEPDGTFRLEDLPAGGVRLMVSSQGFGSANLTLEPIPPGETKTGVEIRLQAGVRVSGVLVDQDGRPVANRRLVFNRPNGGVQVQIDTDEDGRFETEHAPKGRLQAQVYESEGNVSTPVPLGKSFDSPIDGLRLTVRVPEHTIVEGTVSGPDGRPVPICRVTIAPVVDGRAITSPGRGFNWADVDEVVNGEFRREVKGEPPLQIEVSAARGRDGATLNLRGTTVQVADPAAGPVRITLEEGLELVGRVVDGEGRGVAGVVLQALTVLATTDADGVFRLGGLGEGPVHVELTPPPGWVKPDGRAVPAGEEAEFVLLPAAAIAGTVRDEQGHPTTGYARIEASWQAAGDAPSGRVFGSAQNGAFRVDGIPRGVDVRLAVTLYGTSGSTAPVTLDVKAGDEDIEVVVGGGPVIAGVVVGEDGQALAGASLTVLRVGATSAQSVWSQTTEEGRFRVSGVEPGPYHVFVRRPGENESAEMVSVTAPNENVRIALVKPRTIRGRVVGGAPGQVVRVGAWAEGVPNAHIGRRARSEPDGTFVVEGLGSRPVVLVVQRGDQFARSGPIEPGATGVELQLREGTRIAGTVVGADGKPPSFARVVARSDSWEASAWSRDGTFALRGLPPGRYRLVAYGPSMQEAGPEVEVATGSTNVQLRAP